MSHSQLFEFIERMKSDQALRQQVIEAEKTASGRTERIRDDIKGVGEQNWESLKRIAAEHGFDISLNIERPQRMVTPSDQELDSAICLLTCCWLVTSVWDTEGIPTVDGPGCGPGTTQLCPF